MKSWGELLKLPLFPLTEGQEQGSVSVCACVSGAMVGGGGGGGGGQVGRNPQKEKTGNDRVNRCQYTTSQNKMKKPEVSTGLHRHCVVHIHAYFCVWS